MPEIGWAGLGVVPEVDSGFYSKLSRDVDPVLARVGKTSGSRFGSILGKAAAVSAGGAVAAGFAAFKLGQGSIDQASTLNESLNAVNVTYGKQARAVKALGRDAADALGLSNSEFNGLAVRFSAFSKTVAGKGGDVTGVLDDLTTRAADFASVMNLEVNEAAELFQSGLAGETEPLRKYGLDLSAAAVEAHALATGIADNRGELTESEKVQARYSLLMEKTSKAQGDFANTSDSLANRQRILNARWDDAQAKLGTALLPIIEDATGFLLEKGIPAFEDFSDWFTTDGVDGLKRFGGFVRDDVLPVLEDLGGFLKDAAGFGADVVEVFNKLPGDAKMAALGAVLTGGALVKARGGTGVLGAAGKAVGLAAPTPVIVTNWAQIAAGGLAPDGTPIVATQAGAPKTKFGGVAKNIGLTIAAAIAFAFGDDAADKYMDGFERNSKWYTRTQRHFDSVFGQSTKTAFGQAAKDVTNYANEFDKIPETLQSRFNLLGVPETEGQLRHLLRVYDIAAKDRRTTLEILGYDPLLDRIARIGKELDWVSRPREARIAVTRTFSDAGYQTRGGLQEGGGGPVTRNRSRAGGGI